MKILLIEDDDVLIQVLTKSLKPHRYILDVVKDGEMGWNYGSTFEYDLIILDIVLPKLDGISLCQRFRAEGFTTPILLLTSQDTITAKVRGLNAGADDYVVKPFDQAELIARMRALFRRSSTPPLPLLSWGDLLLNLSTCEVSYNGQPLTLSAMEYELLELLLRDSQHVFSTDELIDRLWSSEQFPSEATVRSHIRRVRQKLISVGAPKDFIATVHGRGYYLKAPVATEEPAKLFSAQTQGEPLQPATSTSLTAKSGDPEQLLAGQGHPLASKSEYLAFLNDTWTATKPKSLDQVSILFQFVQDLQADQLRYQQQKQAQQIAHKLAGTLGIFGLTQSIQAARQLEACLDGQTCLQPEQAPLIYTLATTLQQDIESTALIQMSQSPEGLSPLLLLATPDAKIHQPLVDIAAKRGIRIQVAPISTEMKILTSLESNWEWGDQQPDAILFQLPAYSIESDTQAPSTPQAQNLQETWRMFERLYPDTPILVMGERGELSDRIQAMRWGGKLFLEAQTSPEQIIEGVIQFLGRSRLPNKVMILDDDQDWLYALPTLLKPWGFKVTTLANPQQFWTILQAVTPDALVLDINMPQINGFELCQLLRSDPYWGQLPVLFLSALTDPISQRQAFKVGADDYLCKPVAGVELANRILNRLQRRTVSR